MSQRRRGERSSLARPPWLSGGEQSTRAELSAPLKPREPELRPQPEPDTWVPPQIAHAADNTYAATAPLPEPHALESAEPETSVRSTQDWLALIEWPQHVPPNTGPLPEPQQEFAQARDAAWRQEAIAEPEMLPHNVFREPASSTPPVIMPEMQSGEPEGLRSDAGAGDDAVETRAEALLAEMAARRAEPQPQQQVAGPPTIDEPAVVEVPLPGDTGESAHGHNGSDPLPAEPGPRLPAEPPAGPPAPGPMADEATVAATRWDAPAPRQDAPAPPRQPMRDAPAPPGQPMRDASAPPGQPMRDASAPPRQPMRAPAPPLPPPGWLPPPPPPGWMPPPPPPAGWQHHPEARNAGRTRHHTAAEPPAYRQPPPDYRPPPAYRTPRSLDDAEIVDRTHAPQSGWRRAVHKATAGHVNLGDSRHDRETAQLMEQIRQPIHGDFRIAVLSIKGGVGKTTTTLGLGSALAMVRTDRIIAVDANPDRGTLAERVKDATTASTVRHLLADPHISRYADVRNHTRMATSRLEVLASEQDPEVSEIFGEADYRRTVDILRHYYNIILTDCGTGIMHSAMSGVLDMAHTIVLVSSPAIDAARSASATLDWLTEHGYSRLVREAHVVLSASRPGSATLKLDMVYEHFEARCRSIHLVPFDPHLAEGADVDFSMLKPATFQAYLELAGAVAEHFPTLNAARRGR